MCALQAFATFGSEVTVLVRAARLLPRDDVKAAEVLQASGTVDLVTVTP